ncbi:MAG: D-glycero-beta-D-manno-heptose 1-phosphate adenylyltransferase [Draconibacterium sp.]|nr:D-glycero-beta-D-manno-heptose 1-phosphate adenylyltransferase [Draconibacterium sp.]
MRFNIQSKIFPVYKAFHKTYGKWKAKKETVVFTNGCFDIIHQGHIDSLLKAAELGTKLIIGLNSDESVFLLKGINRPVFDVRARATMLAALGFVDAVIIFNEETPASLIQQIIPDVLVKGKDYKIHEIVGHEIVLKNGGQVKTLDLVPDISTSKVIKRIKLLEEEVLINCFKRYELKKEIENLWEN